MMIVMMVMMMMMTTTTTMMTSMTTRKMMMNDDDDDSNRGEVRRGILECSYHQEEFTICEVVISNEFLVTRKNTLAGKIFFD